MNELRKTEIYQQYYPKVLGYLNGKLNSRHDAEDLCADVFVKVYSHIDEFDESKASISTWIYTITRNTLFDHFRTNHVSAEIDETYKDDSDVEAEVCSNETLEELADALEQIPERERDIIMLHYYDKVPLMEIADRMGVSYSYAKVLHKKALSSLGKFMQ